MKTTRLAAAALLATSMLCRNAPTVDDDTRRQPMSGDTGKRLMSFSPDSYSADTHTVDAILSSGAAVQRFFFVEELEISTEAVDLSRAIAGQVKLLDSHDQDEVDAIVGTVGNVRVENGQLLGTLTFGQTDRAKQIEGMVARGELTGVSIGYQVSTWTMTSRENDVETWTATRWQLLEVSLVSVPADANAGVRSQAGLSPGKQAKEDDMKRNQPGGAPAATPTPAPAVAPAPAAPAAIAEPTRSAEPAPAASPVATRRHNLFTAVSALAFVDSARAFGDAVATRAQELIAQNSRDEISVEAAGSELLTAQAAAQRASSGGVGTGGSAITITADERDKMFRGAQNSLIQRAGLSDLFTKAAETRGENVAEVRRALDPGEYRGIRNAELARLFLERTGVRVSTYDRDVIIGQALTHVDATRALVGNSTSDFANLLENTLHKVLQAAYAITPDTWRRFCGIGTLMDFRPHPRYLLGTFGTLDSLTEDGEFKQKSIPDAAKESITGSTKGNIIGITRQALVNDDLDAFGVLGVQFGRAAALTIEVDVYASLGLNSGNGPTMNDGHPLFDATHGNISATPAAPSVAAFDDARVGMSAQKDPSGNEVLDIAPSVWLGPKTLLGTAQVTNDALYDPDTPNKLQKPNMVRGLFADMVGTARLSGTPWFAFADKADAPALEVAFLNGIQDPYLEQRLGWRVDGTEYKVRLDYGVGAINWRSAWKNAGA